VSRFGDLPDAVRPGRVSAAAAAPGRVGPWGRVEAFFRRRGGGLLYWVVVCALFWISWKRVVETTKIASPDSIHYYGQALVFSGVSRPEAFRQSTALFDGWGWPGLVKSVEELLDWDLVRPRVAFPLLASPLVGAWDWAGMVALALALGAAFYAVTAAALLRRHGLVPALGAVLAVFGCQAWFFFAVTPLTEGLSALLLALALGCAWAYRRAAPSRAGAAGGGGPDRPGRFGSRLPRWLWLLGAGLLMLVFAFSRQAQLVPAGALLAAWAGEWIRSGRPRNSWSAPAAVIVGVSAATQVYQLIVYPLAELDQFRLRQSGETTWEALLALPRRFLGVTAFDIKYSLGKDPGLVFAMVLLVAAVIVAWRRVEVQMALGAALAGLVYHAVNGSDHLEFRYLEPGFFVYALAVGALLAHLAAQHPSPGAIRAAA
jgi:hypothetical protein